MEGDGSSTFERRPSAGRRLGRYELLREVGEGGMGVVYEAFDSVTRKHVALKALRHMSADLLYHLKREFRTLQGLAHPNLIRLGEMAESDGTWYFTMELLDGVDLLTFLGGAGPLESRTLPPTAPLESDELPARGSSAAPSAAPRPTQSRARVDTDKVRWAFAELARGLCAVHEAGKVHRDVKPSNVLVTRDQRVVLLDFGLVSDGELPAHTEEVVRGTLCYMAPEQAAGRATGPAADWYSVGVSLFEVLTGQLPVSGPALHIMAAKQSLVPVAPALLWDGCPPDLSELCLDLLKLDPAQRPLGKEVLERLGAEIAPVHGNAEPMGHDRIPFVGRDKEIEKLWLSYERARRGDPQTILVCGESGIGKTALIQYFTRRLSERDASAVLLRGRCYQNESVPYKAVDGVIDALSHYLRAMPSQQVESLLPRHAELLPRVFPVLARVAALASKGAPQVGDQALDLRDRTFAVLRQVLGRIAERSPLVVVIDDLQWTDNDSLSVLQSVLAGANAPSLLLLASLRSGTRTPQLEALMTTTALPNVTRIDMGPLEPSSAAKLAGELTTCLYGQHIDHEQSELLAKRIASGAGGHPFFIAELVRFAQDGGRVSGPPLIQDAILYRVRQLPSSAQRLLDLVVLGAGPIGEAVLLHAARCPPDALERDLQLLLRNNLLRSTSGELTAEYEPYHDRVRDAIAASLDATACRELHGAIATSLEAVLPSAPPELLVRHLRGAGRLAEASVQAQRAARRAADALAFDRAVELYQMALQLKSTEAPGDTELELQLSEVLIRAGRGAEAAAVLMAVATRAPAALSIDCRIRAAEQWMVSGDVDPGLRTLRDLFAEHALAYPKTERRAVLSVLWRRLGLKLGFGSWFRRKPSQAAKDLVSLRMHSAAVRGLLLVDPLRAAYFATRGLLIALRARDPFYVVQFMLHEAAFQGSEGHRGLAYYRRRQRRAADIARSSGDPILQGMAEIHEGVAAFFEERDLHALDKLASGESILATATGTAWEITTPRFFQLETLRRTGHLTQLAEKSQAWSRDAERRGDRYTYTTIQRIANIVWLAADDVETASAQLRKAVWTAPTEAYHIQHWYELRAQCELLLYGSGELDRVWLEGQLAALDRSLLQRTQTIRMQSDWLRARLALEHASARDTHAQHEVRRRARRLAREGTAYGRLLASLLEANLAELRGEQTKLVALLETADQLGSALHFSVYASAARLKRARTLQAAHLAAQEVDYQRSLGIRSAERFQRLLFREPETSSSRSL